MADRIGVRVFPCLMLLVCILATGQDAFAAGKERRPNVLLISVDDLNDWVGVLGGHPQAQTPNIDRLARRGALFTNAHTAAPACNPSRTALMTGIRPAVSGVYANRSDWRRALPDALTIPQHFSRHGYKTIGAGKLLHGRFSEPDAWDVHGGKFHAAAKPENRPANGIPNTRHFDWGPVDAGDAAFGDQQKVRWAAEQLQAEHGKPFFMAVGLYRPHLPWYVPKKYFQRFPPDEIQLPEVPEDDLADVPKAGRRMARQRDHRRVIRHDQWHEAVRGYLASVRFADAMVGELLDALQRSRYAENTIVLLWSDHGWHLGEKRSWRKFTLWEESTRIPMIVVAPGVTEPGTRCDAPVGSLDVYPTLIDLCGVPATPRLEGRSLRPLLENPDAQWDRPVVTTMRRGHHAVRSRRWRYIRYRNGDEELYDHRNDPRELDNLADDPRHADVKRRLANWLPDRGAEPAPLVPR